MKLLERLFPGPDALPPPLETARGVKYQPLWRLLPWLEPLYTDYEKRACMQCVNLKGDHSHRWIEDSDGLILCPHTPSGTHRLQCSAGLPLPLQPHLDPAPGHRRLPRLLLRWAQADGGAQVGTLPSERYYETAAYSQLTHAIHPGRSTSRRPSRFGTCRWPW